MSQPVQSVKRAAIPNETYRRIARDAIQTKIAKLQVWKHHVSSPISRRECDAAINQLLDLLTDLCGTRGEPQPPDEPE